MIQMSKANIENRPLPKRFYAAADAAPHEGGFVITLDGKFVRTPQGALLQHASQQLVAAIVAEWQAQGEYIETDSMPLTRLLNIALDRVEIDREALLADITHYAQTDLLCYRMPTEPLLMGEGGDPHRGEGEGNFVTHDSSHAPTFRFARPSCAERGLHELQVQHFDPILAWADETYALHFECTAALIPITQPQASITKIAALFAAANHHELAALALITPILGSALLTLALWKGRLDADEALIAAHLDEMVHAMQWGDAPEMVEKWAAKCRDVKAAAMFLASCAH